MVTEKLPDDFEQFQAFPDPSVRLRVVDFLVANSCNVLVGLWTFSV